MHVIAHSSTHGAELGQLAALRGGRASGPARSSVAWVSTTLPVAGEVLRRRRSARPRSRARSRGSRRARARARGPRGSREGARRRRRSRRCPGPGCRAARRCRSRSPGGCSTSGATRSRAPRSSATSTAAGFTPPTSRSQQMPPNTEIASPTSRCTAHASEAVGESCDFKHHGAMPAPRPLRAPLRTRRPSARGAGRGRSDNADRPRPVRSTLMRASEQLLSPDHGSRVTIARCGSGARPTCWRPRRACAKRSGAAMAPRALRRFPSPDGRIPNFVGAEAAADALAATPRVGARPRTIKSNPDSPQLPVRVRALDDGKLVYMAVPRLAEPIRSSCSIPHSLPIRPRQAATIKRRGALRAARSRSTRWSPSISSSPVAWRWAKTARGSARAAASVISSSRSRPRAGLVESRHHRRDHRARRPGAGGRRRSRRPRHDMHVDLIVTPTRIVRRTRPARNRLPELDWSQLTPEKIAAIPLLGVLRAGGDTDS